MNIFLHEFRAYGKSTVIWSCSLAVLIILFLSLFPSFSQNVAELDMMMEGFPEVIRKAIGWSSQNTLASILNFYAWVFLYIVLCGSVQAMTLGTSIVSKEIREKTADFLLTKPVSRSKIMTAKLAAALAALVVTNLIYGIASNLMASLVHTGPYNHEIFLMISATLFFVQLMFLALGLFISVLLPKIKSVISFSLGTVFFFFIVNMISTSVGDKDIRYFTPFSYYDTTFIIENSSYEISFIIVGLLFVLAAIAASYFVFTKRDIPSV